MKRIDNLTGIRAIAALWVVMFHLSAYVYFHSLEAVVKSGWMGVDIFYVLSGLVLSFVYVSKLPSTFDWKWYRIFLSRRIAKIYPLHIITFCLMLGLVMVARHFHYLITKSDDTAWSAFCNVLMLHSLGLTNRLSWNDPSWSVSAEWIAYSVIFAPMVFLLRRVRIVYVAVLTALLWTSLILLTALVLKSSSVGALTTNGVLRIVPEFLAGYLLFRLLETHAVERGDLVSGVGILLLMTVASFAKRDTWMLLPAVMTLLGGLYAGGGVSDRVFGNRF